MHREIVVDARTGEQVERWVELPGVVSEAEAAAADLALRTEAARAERNARLLACDWTTLPDVPLTDAQRAAWASYRQALRDITDAEGFPAVEWPPTPVSG